MDPLTVQSSAVSFLRRWRELSAGPTALRRITVAITATFTVETLLPTLGCFLAQQGLLATFVVAPFGQVYPSLLDPMSELRTARADVTLLLGRVEDLCSRALAELALLDPDAVSHARQEAHQEIARLGDAILAFERATPGALLVGTLPPPMAPPLGVLDASHPASQGQLVRELNLQLWSALQQSRQARLVDVAGAVSLVGAERAWDPRMALLAGCPFSATGLRYLGQCIARSIAALFVAPAKVVVVDLDNTLWGGVVGEEGPAGLALGPTGLGAAFVAFQEALLALRAQGVLLAVASKNNEADAFEVLDQHPGMRLRRSDLAAYRIGWQAKSQSLRELAQELALGLESFVLIDDSPSECAEVRSVLPEVTVLELPSDPARYVEALRSLTALDRMALTKEDRSRATMVQADKARSALLAAAPSDDAEGLRKHLRSLELSVVVRRLRADDVERAAQLTQKTNQFNLTTVRRASAEVESLRRDPSWRLYALEAHDRFGDYGTTGLAFARQAGPDEWDLDTLLLSCRVLGRGVETALLGALVSDLGLAGARRLTGRFIPTAKNAPARDFFARHGFEAHPGERWVREPLLGPLLDAAHITVRLETT